MFRLANALQRFFFGNSFHKKKIARLTLTIDHHLITFSEITQHSAVTKIAHRYEWFNSP